MIIQKTEIPEVLTVSEVSTLLRCSPQKVYLMAREGELPAIRIGKRGMRFNKDKIHRMLGGVDNEG